MQGVIFDKDGTLFGFHDTWAPWASEVLLWLADGDADRAAALGQTIGFDTETRVFDPGSIVIAGTPVEIAMALAPSLPDWEPGPLADEMNARATTAALAEVVPLGPFTAGLRRRGLKIGVVTNDGEAPARAHLAAAGVLEAFDFVAGSDSGFGAKPEPGQLLAFAKAQDLAPDRIAMVGDSTHDLMAARAAGMVAVGVLTGLATPGDLAPHADVVLDDIGALAGWLDAQG